MDKRKELILNTIIKEHIKTGTPVGSGVLVEKYKLDISPATVRNEMAELEEAGFIVQPYTSAGRIPTEKAYRLYLAGLDFDSERVLAKINSGEKNELDRVLRQRDEAGFKEAAKIISSLSGGAVFWAFHRHNVYYTGISRLFQQPEFSQTDMIFDISLVIDRIDEIVNEIFNNIELGEHVLIGSENPFGNVCSTVMSKYRLGDNIGLYGILGPMRMNYEKNISLIKFIFNRLSD